MISSPAAGVKDRLRRPLRGFVLDTDARRRKKAGYEDEAQVKSQNAACRQNATFLKHRLQTVLSDAMLIFFPLRLDRSQQAVCLIVFESRLSSEGIDF